METKAKYSTLTKYISQMKNDTIGEWVIDRKNDGTPGHPIQMPYVNYSEMVLRFMNDVYAFNENNRDMKLDRYREIMQENGFRDEKSITTADVATLTPQCILAFITGLVRTERFSDGVLLQYFKNGCIRKWLEKLEALDCEEQRASYKPDRINVLFIGESRPQGGTFFYYENSMLFNETKRAFNEYSGNDNFSRDSFKQWNCWLYDICDKPVNGLPKSERNECIRNSIPRLVELVQKEEPKYIIVCKKDFVEKEIKESVVMSSYLIDDKIFFLPFPACGNQKKYREGLIRALNAVKI